MAIMEHTIYKIKTNISLLASFLRVFSIFKTSLWYDNENIENNAVENIGIRCRNCEKNWFICKKTNYKDMVTKFVLIQYYIMLVLHG